MINLLFGRSGSGKTRHIKEQIKRLVGEKKKVYLLVPEQQVFVSEAMISELPDDAALYFEVISFSSMCEAVFGKYGGLTYTAVSAGMRSLIMWKSLKELSTTLEQYGQIKADAKFSSLMLLTIDELKANSVSVDELEELAARTEDPILSRKLKDICAAYAAFDVNIESSLGALAMASENKLSRLEQTLSRHSFFEGSHVFVDSFTDFTGIQHKILSQIMRQAEYVCISLSAEGRGIHMPHTESVTDTVRTLTKNARACGKECVDITPDLPMRAQSEALRLVERCLWNFDITPQNAPTIPEDSRADIELAKCRDEFCETEYAAMRILDAHKNGIKFSEMAVILRDAESRGGVIDAIFSKYGIPYFLSGKTQLTATPLSRFILSSLRCISRNYRLTDVLTLLKTGLCGINDADADMFEEYCLSWNINGKTFTEPIWSMNPNGYVTDKSARIDAILRAANLVRDSLITPLEELKIRFRAADGDLLSMCRSLYDYMEQKNIREKLCELATLELEHRDIKSAGELLRVYDCIVSSLSDICRVMGGMTLTADELYEAIEIMLSHSEIASVPPISECVTVGSAATLRVEGIKLGIIMELCEGSFPASFSEKGLLCESDKEMLEGLGLSLTSRRDKVISDELFFVYRAMTKPSEKLILTTYSATVTGSKKFPSAPYTRLKDLFKLTEQSIDTDKIRSLAESRRATLDIAQRDARAEKLFSEAELISRTDNLSPIDTETDETFIEKIPVELVRKIFGDGINLSKSKIQTFVGCPMSFWGESVLKLRKLHENTVSVAESGTLVHYVLENLLRELRLPDGSVPKVSHEDLLSMTTEWVDRYVRALGCPITPPTMFNFSKIRNMAYVLACNVTDELANSDFKIFSFEQNISRYGKGKFSPLAIRLGNEDNSPSAYLGGQVDRIDTYTRDGVTYVRVVDYKTSSYKFKKDDVISGVDMQLPAYLFTVASKENASMLGTEVFPACAMFVCASESHGKINISRSGMIYLNDDYLHATNRDMDFSYISTDTDAKLHPRRGQPASLENCPELLSSDELGEIKSILHDTVYRTGCEIYSGEIRRTPSVDSCKYCCMRQSCPVAKKSSF